MRLSGASANHFEYVFSQSGTGIQSSSVNTRNSPFALAAPLLRAAAGPACELFNRMISRQSVNGRRISSGDTGLPSSTTITSKLFRGKSSRVMPSRHLRNGSVRWYVGMMMENSGELLSFIAFMLNFFHPFSTSQSHCRSTQAALRQSRPGQRRR